MTADLFSNLCSYGSDILFYHGAFIFEDVGVTAFAGAVPVNSAAHAPVSIVGMSIRKLLNIERPIYLQRFVCMK